MDRLSDDVARFHARRSRMFLGLAAALPVFGALVTVGVPFSVAGPVGFAPLLVGLGALAAFRCPRCGRTFVWGDGYGNAFATRCVHCRHSLARP